VRSAGQARGAREAGALEGEVKIEGLLGIEPHGEIEDTVRARGVLVEGELRGNVESADQVELRASGRVLGDITCRKLAMAEGCFFQGGSGCRRRRARRCPLWSSGSAPRGKGRGTRAAEAGSTDPATRRHLVAFEAQPTVTRALLLRRIVEAWVAGERRQCRAGEPGGGGGRLPGPHAPRR